MKLKLLHVSPSSLTDTTLFWQTERQIPVFEVYFKITFTHIKLDAEIKTAMY